jgi:hypothetical protein
MSNVPRGILSSRGKSIDQNIFKTYGYGEQKEELDHLQDDLTTSTHDFKRMETISSITHSRAKSKDTLDFEDRRAARDFERSTEYSLKRK